MVTEAQGFVGLTWPMLLDVLQLAAVFGAEHDGVEDKGSLMAGQSVGRVDTVMPLEEIMPEFIDDGEAQILRLKETFNT